MDPYVALNGTPFPTRPWIPIPIDRFEGLMAENRRRAQRKRSEQSQRMSLIE